MALPSCVSNYPLGILAFLKLLALCERSTLTHGHPYPKTSGAFAFDGLSYSRFHPLVSSMYLKKVSKMLIELDVRNLLGNGVHSLACKFEGYLQQLL